MLSVLLSGILSIYPERYPAAPLHNQRHPRDSLHHAASKIILVRLTSSLQTSGLDT
jgi:hypothetical protein